MNRSFTAVAVLLALFGVLASCTSTPAPSQPTPVQEDPQVPKLKTEIDSLKKQIEEKDLSLADLIKQKDALTREKADLESKAAQLEPLTQEKTELEAKNAELEGRISELEREKSELEAKNAQLEQIKADLEGRIATLDQSRKDKSILDLEKADLENKLAKMTTRADDAEKKLAQANAKNDSLSAENKRMWTDFDSYKNQIASLESRIAKLQKDLDSKTAQANSLETKVGQLNKDKDSLSATIKATSDELKKSIAELTAENEALNDQIAMLEQEKTELEAALQRNSLRLADIETQLKGELAEEIASGNVEILQYENVLIVNVKDEVMFDADRPELRAEFEPTLRTLADVVKKVPEKLLRVEGNTAVAQSSPEILKLYPTSWHLGAARASNVVRFLQEQCGIDPLRLVATSFGEYRPVAENTSVEGKERNRRVQFVLIDRPLYEIAQLKLVSP